MIIPKGTNTPYLAFATIALFVTAVVVLIITDHAEDSTLFIGFVITTCPSIVAAIFAERAAKDIRNHVVQEKARAGTEQALAAIDLPVTPKETGDVVRDVLNEPTDEQGRRAEP